MQPNLSIASQQVEAGTFKRFPLRPLKQRHSRQVTSYLLPFLGGMCILIALFGITGLSGSEQQAVVATALLAGLLLWNIWMFLRRKEREERRVCFRIDLDAAFLLEQGEVKHKASLKDLRVQQIDSSTLELTGANWPPLILTKEKLLAPKGNPHASQYGVSPTEWQSLLRQLNPSN